jgi:hypothetical protein
MLGSQLFLEPLVEESARPGSFCHFLLAVAIDNDNHITEVRLGKITSLSLLLVLIEERPIELFTVSAYKHNNICPQSPHNVQS